MWRQYEYAIFIVTLVLLVFDVVVFPIIAAKGGESENWGWCAFKFGMFAAALIIVLETAFFAFLYIVPSFSGFIISLFVGAPVLNWIIIYFITKKLNFIDGRGMRVAYSALTAACLIMSIVCLPLLL